MDFGLTSGSLDPEPAELMVLVTLVGLSKPSALARAESGLLAAPELAEFTAAGAGSFFSSSTSYSDSDSLESVTCQRSSSARISAVVQILSGSAAAFEVALERVLRSTNSSSSPSDFSLSDYFLEFSVTLCRSCCSMRLPKLASDFTATESFGLRLGCYDSTLI